MVEWKELWWNNGHRNLCWISGNVNESWRGSVRSLYRDKEFPDVTYGSGERFKERPLTKGLLYW